jgi:polar amino acid transport system ATP-binding protein
VSEPAVEITGLKKSFGTLDVLKGIDVRVDRGDVVCIIGPSGSGKSTLLRCVNLLEEPTGGKIVVNGVELTDPDVDIDAARTKIGMVFQSFNLFSHLSVLNNLTVAQRSSATPSRRRRSRCATWSGSGCPTRSTPCPASCPVASSSAWPSRGRCRWTRT